jgi:hypothetical protein
VPRPAIGQAAKDQIVSIRLTQREVNDLTRRYGSPGKGLRALLTAYKGSLSEGVISQSVLRARQAPK